MRQSWYLYIGFASLLTLGLTPALFAQPLTPEAVNLDPAVVEESPVLQRWLEAVPDVGDDIRHDPSFRSRVRFGYSNFPSTAGQGGWHVGVEDLFLGDSAATVSAGYQGTWSGDRATWGGDLRYYLRPLGDYFNVAPVVGYRHITTEGQQTDGINLGIKVQFALSRTGAADLALQQSFVSVGTAAEVGITSLSLGYAIAPHLRLATDLEKQNSRYEKDSRVGISLEWLF